MNSKIFAFAAYLIILISGCKGHIIPEPRFGTYEFNTYTIDTLRLKVIMNGVVLTDSLLTPKSTFSSVVKFFSSTGRILILDASNNEQVVLDSMLQMKIGITSISIVQFNQGEKPSAPAPPNEPPPAAGNYKVRIQYVKPVNPSVPFFDTVRCVVFDYNGLPIDTVDLAKYGATPFYEDRISHGFTVKLYKSNFTPLHSNPVAGSISSQSEGFKTAIVYGTGTTSNPNIYQFRSEVVY